MAQDRREYTVTVGGVEHTVLLDSEDAKRFGARAVEAKRADAPANKARTPGPSK